MCILASGNFLFGEIKQDELPPPYNSIEILPPYYFDNWFVNAKHLDNLIKNHNVSVIVELGSWLGASAMHMARQIPIYGKVYCVDHWEGSAEHHQPHRTDVKHLLPILYQQFLSNVIHAGLTDKIIPIRESTLEAAKNLDVSPHLVYVDASHDYFSVYQDISNWYEKLIPGGIMCGDDWPREGVYRAVERFAEENNLQVYAEDNFWSYSPKPYTSSTTTVLRSTPWFTEEAVAFLDKFLQDHPNAYILEFGTGASTVWLAQRTNNLISIEHDRDWYGLITNELEERQLRSHVFYLLYPRPYYIMCKYLAKNSFDLVIVDGRNRKGCIAHSLDLLKPGGVLMLDNAERTYYHSVFPLMKNWQKFESEQFGPDKEGFWYKGWKTFWWIKPDQNLVKK